MERWQMLSARGKAGVGCLAVVGMFVLCIIIGILAPESKDVDQGVQALTETADEVALAEGTPRPEAANTSGPSQTPGPTDTPRPTRTPKPDIGKWQVNRSVSEFDDSMKVIIGVKANSSVKGWLSSHTPVLYVRCQEGRTDVIVDVGMRSSIEGLYNKHTVRIRLDKEPARELAASESTDGESLFFPNGQGFAAEMLGHDTLLFGFTPFNGDPQTTTFDIAGLEEAIKPLREACHW